MWPTDCHINQNNFHPSNSSRADVADSVSFALILRATKVVTSPMLPDVIHELAQSHNRMNIISVAPLHKYAIHVSWQHIICYVIFNLRNKLLSKPSIVIIVRFSIICEPLILNLFMPSLWLWLAALLSTFHILLQSYVLSQAFSLYLQTFNWGAPKVLPVEQGFVLLISLEKRTDKVSRKRAFKVSLGLMWAK